MTEYILTEKSNLVAVANSVRKRTGGTGKITLGEMIDNINYDIGGVELPELTNEGTASDLLAGKQLIDQEGNIVEGTIATKTSSNLTASGATVTVPAGYYATQATKSVATATQATPTVSIDSTGKITATATQAAGYVAAGSKSATKQLAFQPAKTITPSTASQIAVSSGYYTGGDVTVVGDANLKAENIAEGVSIFGVNCKYTGNVDMEDNLITRPSSFTSYYNDRISYISSCAFYKNDRIKMIDFPLVTTIGESAFIYCYSITTANFPALLSTGKYAFCQCSSLKDFNAPNATYFSEYAFSSCRSLTELSLPNVTGLGSYAFNSCGSLTMVNFPQLKKINGNVFQYCSNLTTTSFPLVGGIYSYALAYCQNLQTISFPSASVIYTYAFRSCYNLKSLYLTGSSLCKLSKSDAFYSTPIGGYSASAGTYGSIYVPASLLTSYQTATNWAYFSSRFVGI